MQRRKIEKKQNNVFMIQLQKLQNHQQIRSKECRIKKTGKKRSQNRKLLTEKILKVVSLTLEVSSLKVLIQCINPNRTNQEKESTNIQYQE